MIRGLVEKECRQHGVLITFLLMLLSAGLLMMLNNEALSRMGGSPFMAVQQLLRFFLPVTGLVLGNALVAGEFRQRTQVFLEGLPMPRWLMIAVKYTIGLLAIVAAAEIILGAGWWASHGSEALTPVFAGLLTVKAAGWAWFCWSLCFAHAFLGRYRIATGLVIVGGLLWAEQKGMMIDRFGPFDLVGERFPYERLNWPVQQLWITAAVCASLTAFGFALGLVRDATLATMLSEKMSSREKLAMGAITLVAFSMIGMASEQKRDTKPLHLPGAVDVSLRAATVSAAAAVSAPTDEEKAALDKHAHAAAELLASAADYLHCAHLPPLYLVHRRDMGKYQVEDGDLDSRQGCLLRANLVATGPDDGLLQYMIIERILAANQHFRLRSDTRGWIVEGFAKWWPIRDKAKTVAEYIQMQRFPKDLADCKITGVTLQNWLHYRHKMGLVRAQRLAGVGVMTLGEAGEDKRQQFLATILGYSAPHDARACLHDAFNNVLSVLPATTGMDLNTLATKWTAALPKKEVKQ